MCLYMQTSDVLTNIVLACTTSISQDACYDMEFTSNCFVFTRLSNVILRSILVTLPLPAPASYCQMHTLIMFVVGARCVYIAETSDVLAESSSCPYYFN